MKITQNLKVGNLPKNVYKLVQWIALGRTLHQGSHNYDVS